MIFELFLEFGFLLLKEATFFIIIDNQQMPSTMTLTSAWASVIGLS